MRREQQEIGGGTLIAYGHYGRPFLVFPSEQGRAWDFESNGMIDAVRPLLDDGRLKLYCVDSFDAASWSNRSMPIEQRSQQHDVYESWIVNDIVPAIHHDCGGAAEIGTVGCSLGAFHAVLFGLRRADLFPFAFGMSGNYDPSTWDSWGDRGDAAYFANPVDFVPNLHGDHLNWLRERLSVLLVVGQGQWEDSTGSLPSTQHFAHLLREKGLRCELDMWGHDVPHDWPSWRAQLGHHLPRFC